MQTSRTSRYLYARIASRCRPSVYAYLLPTRRVKLISRPGESDFQSAMILLKSFTNSTVAASASGLALPVEEAVPLLAETFRGRAGDTGYPADLLIVVDDAEQRNLLSALLSIPPA